MTATPTQTGLEGVIAADTRLSLVDGQRGRLIIAGHPLDQLAGHVDFEAVCALLWHGALPDGPNPLRQSLAAARIDAFERLPLRALKLDNAMEALRAAAAQTISRGDALDATAIVGAIAVWAAAWARFQAGKTPLAPHADAGHGEDLLWMMRGDRPSEAETDAINTYLVSTIDHGMNASTFTARVVASTGSDLVSAVTAAIGALKGPLHGGAPGPVLDMLDAVGTPDNARAWLTTELDAGRRIMGMGHRVYRVRDPRAAVLEAALSRLEAAQNTHRADRLALARAVEHAAEALLAERKPDRPLRANVEFYTATLLEALEIPRGLFTGVFCASRAAGWSAHAFEQRAVGRLIRPRARYTGPMPTPA